MALDARNFYEDRDARISILPRGLDPRRDTLKQTDHSALSIKSIAHGTGQTFLNVMPRRSKKRQNVPMPTLTPQAASVISGVSRPRQGRSPPRVRWGLTCDRRPCNASGSRSTRSPRTVPPPGDTKAHVQWHPPNGSEDRRTEPWLERRSNFTHG